MTTQQQKRSPVVDELSDEAVAQYLQSHPEFFERHSALLASLRLPHKTGNAVSLVERQVAILRTRTAKLERKLQELLAAGRANDALAAKGHRLAVALISARDRDSALAAIDAALREDFAVEHTVLLLFVKDGGKPHSDRFVRCIGAGDPQLKAIASLLEAVGPRCGRPTDAQRTLLFGEAQIGSAALVPIGGGERLGVLALGSTDPNRFLPTMSVEFLARIGELVSQAVVVHTG